MSFRHVQQRGFIMNTHHELIVVWTTIESTDQAERLAKTLVSESLAACVQIDGPITSHYRWAGQVQSTTEYRLAIKSSMAAWPRLRERLAILHPYDEPEILVTIVDHASDGYRTWAIDQTT